MRVVLTRETKREFNAFCRVSHYVVILRRLIFFKSANCLAASYNGEYESTNTARAYFHYQRLLENDMGVKLMMCIRKN